MIIRLAIGADHRGFAIKELLVKQQVIAAYTIAWHDVGAYTAERSDYPLFAQKVSTMLREKAVDYGILLCGTGIGMAMAANRYQGNYAGVAWNTEIACRARQEDAVNILCLPTDYLTYQQVYDCLGAWLSASFKGGRYQQRLTLVDAPV